MNSARKLQQLVQDTEELLSQIADQRGPEIQKVRDRLEDSIEKTKSILGKERPASQVKVRDVAGSVNDYVREYPWMALATGVLLASTLGILATSATKRSLHR
jgi:ElaB/YqjD/DUF883 family membrane-anchored ribosome-binding protein